MLRIENLEAVYHESILALGGVTLVVPDGGKVALLGTNGAGKTTTMRCVTGLTKSVDLTVKKGLMEFDGVRLDGRTPAQSIRLGISLVPEGRRVFDDLTVDENLTVGAYLRGDAHGVREDYEKVMHYFPQLTRLRRQLAGYLSGGEQQMLAIARALMAQPKLLMLDEPSLGLAPRYVREIFQILTTINAQEGTAILLVEQNANLALRFAEYGYIIENGRVVLDGPTERLLVNQDVREFYLGVTASGERKSFREVKSYKKRKRWLG